MYLGEPLSTCTGSPSGLVVMSQQVSTLASASGAGLELVAQDVGESAFAGFDDGAGVVGDQPAQHGIGVLGVAKVPGAVELVQAGSGEARGVADVVQPGGGFQQIGVRAENRCQAACPGGDALDVRPAPGRGSWRSARASCWAHGCQRVHESRLGSCGGTFTDLACRLKDVLPSIRSRHPAMLAQAKRVPSSVAVAGMPR